MVSLKQDFRLYLLFRELRPSTLRHLDSSFFLLFKVLDLLPYNFSSVIIDLQTALVLPIAVATLPADSTLLSRSIARLSPSCA